MRDPGETSDGTRPSGAPSRGAIVDTYRFHVTVGWLAHLLKSAIRQDHAQLAAPLARLLPRDGVAIDVGAHGGQITRLLARIAVDGTVVAVEPSSYTRAVLRPALWLRGVRNVTVVAAALGAGHAIGRLTSPRKRRGEVGYGLATLAGGGAGMQEVVPVIPLDALIAELGLQRVDLIKADIEGYEGAMLAGAREVLRRFRPAVLLEMNRAWLERAGWSLPTLWNDLLGQGFRPFRLVPFQAEPEPCPDGPEEGDILWLPCPAP